MQIFYIAVFTAFLMAPRTVFALESSKPIIKANPAGEMTDLKVSPDGKKALYLEKTLPGGEGDVIDNHGKLIHINLMKNTTREITSDLIYEGEYSWSRSGGKFAYKVNNAIYISSRLAAPARALLSGEDFARESDQQIGKISWEPSEKFLYFISESTHAGKKGIWRVNVHPGSLTKIFEVPEYDTESYMLTPAVLISPDGKWLIFNMDHIKDKEGRQNARARSPWLLDIKDKTMSPMFAYDHVPEGQWFISAESWSPDSKEILLLEYTRDTDGDGQVSFRDNSRISKIAVKDLQKTMLTTNSTCREHFPIWSPDGKSIAYVRSCRNMELGNIWMMKRDGKAKKQLTRFEKGRPFHIRWLPGSDGLTFQYENKIALLKYKRKDK